MSRNVSDHQTIIRDVVRDTSLILTDSKNLDRFNRLIRKLVVVGKLSEFRRQDTSLNTTDGTESYTMPTDPLFWDVTNVEIKEQDGEDWVVIRPAPTELDWARLANRKNDMPENYLLADDGTNNVIQFRPIPDWTGTSNIRLTGYVEPVEVDNSSVTTTEFRTTLMDDVLDYLFASDVLARREFRDAAQQRQQDAARMMSSLMGREIAPEELVV